MKVKFNSRHLAIVSLVVCILLAMVFTNPRQVLASANGSYYISASSRLQNVVWANQGDIVSIYSAYGVWSMNSTTRANLGPDGKSGTAYTQPCNKIIYEANDGALVGYQGGTWFIVGSGSKNFVVTSSGYIQLSANDCYPSGGTDYFSDNTGGVWVTVNVITPVTKGDIYSYARYANGQPAPSSVRAHIVGHGQDIYRNLDSSGGWSVTNLDAGDYGLSMVDLPPNCTLSPQSATVTVVSAVNSHVTDFTLNCPQPTQAPTATPGMYRVFGTLLLNGARPPDANFSVGIRGVNGTIYTEQWMRLDANGNFEGTVPEGNYALYYYYNDPSCTHNTGSKYAETHVPQSVSVDFRVTCPLATAAPTATPGLMRVYGTLLLNGKRPVDANFSVGIRGVNGTIYSEQWMRLDENGHFEGQVPEGNYALYYYFNDPNCYHNTGNKYAETHVPQPVSVDFTITCPLGEPTVAPTATPQPTATQMPPTSTPQPTATQVPVMRRVFGKVLLNGVRPQEPNFSVGIEGTYGTVYSQAWMRLDANGKYEGNVPDGWYRLWINFSDPNCYLNYPETSVYYPQATPSSIDFTITCPNATVVPTATPVPPTSTPEPTSAQKLYKLRGLVMQNGERPRDANFIVSLVGVNGTNYGMQNLQLDSNGNFEKYVPAGTYAVSHSYSANGCNDNGKTINVTVPQTTFVNFNIWCTTIVPTPPPTREYDCKTGIKAESIDKTIDNAPPVNYSTHSVKVTVHIKGEFSYCDDSSVVYGFTPTGLSIKGGGAEVQLDTLKPAAVNVDIATNGLATIAIDLLGSIRDGALKLDVAQSHLVLRATKFKFVGSYETSLTYKVRKPDNPPQLLGNFAWLVNLNATRVSIVNTTQQLTLLIGLSAVLIYKYLSAQFSAVFTFYTTFFCLTNNVDDDEEMKKACAWVHENTPKTEAILNIMQNAHTAKLNTDPEVANALGSIVEQSTVQEASVAPSVVKAGRVVTVTMSEFVSNTLVTYSVFKTYTDTAIITGTTHADENGYAVLSFMVPKDTENGTYVVLAVDVYASMLEYSIASQDEQHVINLKLAANKFSVVGGTAKKTKIFLPYLGR